MLKVGIIKKRKGIFEPSNWDDLDPMTKKAYNDGFKFLDKDTHIFKGDITPDRIVGGKGYKRRGFGKIFKYIKNNPTRFGKEAGKVAIGAGLVGVGGKLLMDSRENNKEISTKNKRK